jgi:hypothetical protein
MPNLNDPAILALMIPVLALLIPIVAIAMAPVKQALKLRAQGDSRKLYERLAREKLDVLRTAITMGYKEDQLAELDARLERLVGADKLEGLLADKPQTPPIKAVLAQADLETEMERIRQATRISN